MTKDKALTGAAGEYYVAFRLSAEGYAVGLTPRGTTAVDLIVANSQTGKSITLQTKTMMNAFVQSKKYRPYWKWPLGKTGEPKDNLFYAFVDLKGNFEQVPDVFIVPSSRLSSLVEDDSGWAWCTGINVDNESEYKNKWGIIKAALD